MPNLDYILACRLSSIDAQSDTLSLFQLVEEVAVVGMGGRRPEPALLFPLELATRWGLAPGESGGDFLQRVVAVNPTGDETELAVTPFTQAGDRHRVVVRLPPVAVDAPGLYRLEVYLAPDSDDLEWGQQRGSYTIDVRFQEELIRIRLTQREREFLTKEVRGQGGYQSLLRRLQSSVYGNELALTTSDAEKLIRSAQRYGEGGFQARLRPIVEKVSQQLSAILGIDLSSTPPERPSEAAQ